MRAAKALLTHDHSGVQRAAMSASASSIATWFDTRTPVLILNVGTYPYNQSSVGIARSLGRIGIPVYLVQKDSFIPAGGSRYLAGKFVWTTSGLHVDRFLEGMAAIGKTLGCRTILIPTGDLAAILVAENARALSPWFTFAQPPPTLPRSVSSKRRLYQLCRRLGIPCPQTHFPSSRSEVVDLAGRMQFPVIVKGIEPWLLPSGIASTSIVTKREPLIELFDTMSRQSATTSLMVQEMIPSETAEDWIVHGYWDSSGKAARVFTGTKLRSFPAFAGFTTLARCVDNDRLRGEATALLSALDYRGVVDLDYRFDGRDGQYKLLDFNPRIGAQFRLFEDDSGLDVARALHLDLTGRPLPPGQQIEGRTFVSEIYDAAAAWRYFRCGRLTAAEWLGSIRRIDETGWFAADDSVPFLLLCLRMLFRRAPRLLPLSRPPRCDEEPPRFLPPR